VDDNHDIVRVMQRVLSNEGYALRTAHDGEQALDAARTDPPDLILLDVMMPKVDGLQVCRELKDDPETSGIMIIMVTGKGSLDHLVKGFAAGADDYITKPFHIPELLARTRSALRLKVLADDLQQRNRELSQSQTQLLQKEKMATIGILASGIAHEFNNIMGGISGYAQLARQNDKYKDMLVDVAMTQAQRAFELTKSLSTYNRGGADEMSTDVDEIVSGTLCLVEKEAQKCGVQITRDLEEGLVARISPGQFQEVVLNLIINAIHAACGKPGTIHIRARASSSDETVRLEVTDNGCGVSEANLTKIFDPFFTTKGPLGGGGQQGTGLGLTVCYNVVQSNGGDIAVTSKEGAGTTFSVTLPRSREPASSSRIPSLPLPEAATSSPTQRILVIDDEPMAQETLKGFLEQHDVVCCSKAEEGLEAHESKPFDFVILDVCLPGVLNGFQAFDEFEKSSTPPRVVFASGCFPDATYRSYLSRAHGHLLKPFKFEELASLLGLSPSLRAPAVAKPLAQC
jgi:DNA-binding response OmpR family regulator